MCNPALIGLGITAVTAVAQGYQQQQQGEYVNDVAKYNARKTENDAERVLGKGVEEENKIRRATAELQADQKASFGASGVDVNSGSAAQIQQDTALLGEVDALRVRSNFEDQAEVLQDEAGLIRSQGEAAESAGDNAFKTGLLGAGLLGVSSKWAHTKKKTG